MNIFTVARVACAVFNFAGLTLVMAALGGLLAAEVYDFEPAQAVGGGMYGLAVLLGMVAMTAAELMAQPARTRERALRIARAKEVR